MANTTKKSETVTTVLGYTLELTPEEASSLNDLLGGFISGYHTGNRKRLHDIWYSLKQAQCPSGDLKAITSADDVLYLEN